MDGFFDLIKAGGKAVYDFFLFLAVIIFVLMVTLVAIPYPNWHGVAFMIVFMVPCLSFLSGRIILAVATFCILAFHSSHYL